MDFAVYLNLGSLVILNPTGADFDWAGKLLALLVPPPLWSASQPQRRWNGPTARRTHWGMKMRKFGIATLQSAWAAEA
jgi:hypothetical protein